MDYDKLLGIDTVPHDGRFPQEVGCHRYEASPYEGLDLLLQALGRPRSSRLVDFGCGKGRVPLFFHYRTGLEAVGIEMNPALCDDARRNLSQYCSARRKAADKITFHCCMAQKYSIQAADTLFYFFNPFSVGIFSTVVGNILASLAEHPRQARIILYYPSEQYTEYLERYTPFVQEHDLPLDASRRDPRERLTVWVCGE